MRIRSHTALIAAAGILLIASSCIANADTISANLINESSGTEAATNTNWLAVSFGTGATAGNLDTVGLLLSATDGSSLELNLYSDSVLSPGTLLGTLNPLVDVTSTLSTQYFANNSIALVPNTTYWLVLKAISGQVNWSWTTDNSGTGVGYQDTWGSSSDSGATWYTFSTFPLQFAVSETTAATATPEPSTTALFAIGILSCGIFAARKNEKQVSFHG